MVTVTLKKNLIIEPGTNQAGSITFSYEDSQRERIKLRENSDKVSVYFLTKLLIQFNNKNLNIKEFEKTNNFEFTPDQLKALNLAYFKSKNNDSNNFTSVQKVGEKVFLVWKFQLTQDVFFVTDGSAWGIDLTGKASLETAEFSGVLQSVQIEPETPKPVPQKSTQFPKQSPPVNRRTIFDPNQHNADPAVALGSDPNDPMILMQPVACGCHVLSGNSMIMCLTACGLLSSRR